MVGDMDPLELATGSLEPALSLGLKGAMQRLHLVIHPCPSMCQPPYHSKARCCWRELHWCINKDWLLEERMSSKEMAGVP